MADIIDFKPKQEFNLGETIENCDRFILITEGEEGMNLFASGVEDLFEGIDMLHASMGALLSGGEDE